MKKHFKIKNGITLISLVVTIIILLILAGITITSLLGDNALFTKAISSKVQTDIALAKEEIELAITNEQIRVSTEENSNHIFNYENVWNNLRQKDPNLNIKEDSLYKISYKAHLFQIDEGKNVIYIGSDETSGNEKEPTPEPTEYTIVYHKNDGTDITLEQVVQVGIETILSNDKFTIDGYNLIGWYNNAECSGDKITTVNNDAHLYAKWEEQFVTSVSLNHTSLNLDIGIESTLIATVLPSNAKNKNITWTSSNPSVATVNNNGKITTISAGSTIIKAIVTGTSGNNEVSASCNLTVSLNFNNNWEIYWKGRNINISTISSNEINLNATSSAYSWIEVGTSNSIDLTNVKQIELTMDCSIQAYGNAYFGISSNKRVEGSAYASDMAKYISIPRGTNKKIILDVQGITGNYYISVRLSPSNCKITNIRYLY